MIETSRHFIQFSTWEIAAHFIALLVQIAMTSVPEYCPKWIMPTWEFRMGFSLHAAADH